MPKQIKMQIEAYAGQQPVIVMSVILKVTGARGHDLLPGLSGHRCKEAGGGPPLFRRWCVIINPSENIAESRGGTSCISAACCWLSCRVLASFIIASG